MSRKTWLPSRASSSRSRLRFPLRDFPGRSVVAFLGVTHTTSLTSLHRQLYDLVSPTAEVFFLARPDVFVFHCTLGYVAIGFACHAQRRVPVAERSLGGTTRMTATITPEHPATR